VKIGDFDVFCDGGNAVFALVIRKKGIVITGD
jgi:hypothetical protein